MKHYLNAFALAARRPGLLIQDESGVTAIEYALIASLVAVAAIGAMTLVGTNLSTVFTTIAGDL